MGVVKKAAAVVGAGLVLAAALPSLASAAREAQRILVANDETQPVPTQAVGETAVTGSVSITGLPSVAVSGTPAVNVANDQPIDVALAPSEPASFEGNVFVGGPDVDADRYAHQNQEPIGTVPADKRLKIEFVTLTAASSVSDATLLEAFLLVSGGPGELAIYPLQITPHPDGAGHAGVVSQQVALHAPPGATLAFFVSTHPPAEDGPFVASVSGVLTPA